jgi:hypothetical protein
LAIVCRVRRVIAESILLAEFCRHFTDRFIHQIDSTPMRLLEISYVLL